MLNRRDKALTAGEMIVALAELNPDTVLYYTYYDDGAVDYDAHDVGFSGVDQSGYLSLGKCLRSYDYFTGEYGE